MIRIDEIKLGRTADAKELKLMICKKAGIKPEKPDGFSIRRRSVDARKKPDLLFVYSVSFRCADEQKILKRLKKNGYKASVFKEEKYRFPYVNTNTAERDMSRKKDHRPVVVGAGPAGLFCACYLAENGFAPLLLERGDPVDERARTVSRFWKTGELDPESNVQFGEGGAGTFSDGKLNTSIKDGKVRTVLSDFVRFGADPEVMYDNHPHVGTDRLTGILKNIRETIIKNGGEVRFRSKVTGLDLSAGRLKGLYINGDEYIPCGCAVFAIGHSARDTFRMLLSEKTIMIPKTFAAGFRIVHPQELIDRAQYAKTGSGYPFPASYKLTANIDDRGVYSFCMCPGGKVVNASSEKGMTVVNGMSYSGRDSGSANSAIVTTVTPEDADRFLPGHADDPLKCMLFQQETERRAFEKGNGAVPWMYYGEMKTGNEVSAAAGPRDVMGSVIHTDLNGILPGEINDRIIRGIEVFGRRIKGFDSDDAILFGVETRTSSPVRIVRGENFESNIAGLLPCGEGAGYAGGIVSSACDGIRTAEKAAALILNL